MKISLGELAQKFNTKFCGDSNHQISAVAALDTADSHHLSFLSNPKYSSLLESTKAGVVILSSENSDHFQGNKIIATDPYVVFAKVAALFQKSKDTLHEIHANTVIADSAVIGKNVHIGAFSIIGENTVIADETVLEARVTIGNNCRIGKNCLIKPNVVISDECTVGENVILHPGCIIGADGFGLARDKDKWIKVPQLGAVIIGDDCEVGANTTIDRGTMDDTVLENDVHLDNQIQIAHNVRIGAHTVMAGCSAVAGSAKIGKNCLIGGGVGIIGHLEVCDNVTLQSMALVTHSIKKAGSYSSVSPLQETSNWRKSAVRIKQLDKIAKRLARLEKQESKK
jgi:UDP-3-O-[3-hydroxymyristoyl] glucosamine N-acyltransferase